MPNCAFLRAGLRGGLTAMAVSVALFAAVSAGASAQWRLSEADSSLAFRYTEDGQEIEGRFREFEADGAFDPARPERTKFRLRIDVDSIDLPNIFLESAVKGVGWFVVEDYPEAQFQLDGLKPLGGDRYEAVGRLTIKDRSKRLVGEAMLDISETNVRARGEMRFMRRDFRLGGGPEEYFIDIGDEVVVAFDLVGLAPR